jgi:hypothetical protein
VAGYFCVHAKVDRIHALVKCKNETNGKNKFDTSILSRIFVLLTMM